MFTYKTLVLFLISTFFGNGQDIPQTYDDGHIDRGFTARKGIVRERHYIGYEKLIHDINVGDNYFNLEYGFFRSELDGMYVFNFQVISAREYLRVSLRINGKAQVWASAQRGYNQAGNSAVVYMNKGEVAYLYLEEGSIFEPEGTYRGYTTFSGHRLSIDTIPPVIPRVANQRLSQEEKNDIADDRFDEKVFWQVN